MKLPLRERPRTGKPDIGLGVDVVARVLNTIKKGWNLATADFDAHSSLLEVPLTERLREGMRSVVDTANDDLLAHWLVAGGTEMKSKPDLERPDGVADIPIYFSRSIRELGHEPHAIVECKRISGSEAALCRNYVVEGVDRFVSRKYASAHSQGFMTGYVVDGSVESACGGINDYLERQGRLAEKLVLSRAQDEDIFRQSDHLRGPDRHPIELHHTFLLVPTLSPARWSDDTPTGAGTRSTGERACWIRLQFSATST